QAEDGIRDFHVTGVQTCALPILACYAVAGAVLLVVCAAGGQALAGYDATTWWLLVGLVVGPQLLGHTLVNRVLRTTSPMVVSVRSEERRVGKEWRAQRALSK